MSQQLIAILSVGVGIGALNLVIIGWLLRAISQSDQRTEAHIRERFEAQEKRNQERFEAQEKRNQERFEAQEKRTDGIEQGMDRIEQRIDAQDERTRSVEEHVHSIDNQLARIGGLLDGLREAIVQRASRE